MNPKSYWLFDLVGRYKTQQKPEHLHTKVFVDQETFEEIKTDFSPGINPNHFQIYGYELIPVKSTGFFFYINDYMLDPWANSLYRYYIEIQHNISKQYLDEIKNYIPEKSKFSQAVQALIEIDPEDLRKVNGLSLNHIFFDEACDFFKRKFE